MDAKNTRSIRRRASSLVKKREVLTSEAEPKKDKEKGSTSRRDFFSFLFSSIENRLPGLWNSCGAFFLHLLGT